MRRAVLTILFLILLTVPALAETTWTEETAWGDPITYTREDTDWGHILYSVTDGYWVVNFKYGDCIFASCNEYVSVHNEMTGLQTFYRDERWGALYDPDGIAVWAEDLLQNGEVAFVHDVNQSKLILPDVGEVELPAGLSCDIQDAYIRQQRLFMTIDTFDDRHFLYIVTWQNGLDVRAIEIPWSGYFDSYHVGDSNDCIYLWLEMFEEEDGRIAAYEEDGRWILDMVGANDLFFFTPYGVQQDMYRFWAYGTHPWNDIETMDWTTLPLTYEDAVAGLTREGWRFPHESQPIYAAPDVGAELVALCPKDTPVCVIRTEGEWAYVGAQLLDEDGHPCVGYMLTSALEEMPLQSHVLPGGEIAGWFVMMTVENDLLTFAPIDFWTNYRPIPIEVRSGFIDAARAAYQEKGYAATPIGFDESLLPYLKDSWSDRETVCDAIVTDSMLALAVRKDWDDGDSEWLLRIVNGTQEVTNRSDLRMPRPFRFDRERVMVREQMGITFTE